MRTTSRGAASRAWPELVRRVDLRERLRRHGDPEPLADGLPPVRGRPFEQPLLGDTGADSSVVRMEGLDHRVLVLDLVAETLAEHPHERGHPLVAVIDHLSHAGKDRVGAARVPRVGITRREQHERVGVRRGELGPEAGTGPVDLRRVGLHQRVPVDLLAVDRLNPSRNLLGADHDHLDHVMAGPAQQRLERILERMRSRTANSGTDDLEHVGLPCPRSQTRRSYRGRFVRNSRGSGATLVRPQFRRSPRGERRLSLS